MSVKIDSKKITAFRKQKPKFSKKSTQHLPYKTFSCSKIYSLDSHRFLNSKSYATLSIFFSWSIIIRTLEVFITLYVTVTSHKCVSPFFISCPNYFEQFFVNCWNFSLILFYPDLRCKLALSSTTRPSRTTVCTPSLVFVSFIFL